MSVSTKRVPSFAAAILLFAATIMFSFFVAPAHASGPLQITSRSLTLQDGSGGNGGSMPSGVVNHLFTFKLPSSAAAQSIVFMYCTNANIDIGGTCTVPHGLSTTSATLGTEGGDATNFGTLVDNNGSGVGSNGEPVLNAASGFAPGGSTSSTVPLDGVTNPDGTDCSTTPNSCTFYVNIQLWSGTNGTGTELSAGTVAASVDAQIVLSGTMPESLIFCTGGSIPLDTNNNPECNNATSGAVSFPMLFSPTSTAYTTSQMAASTNATTGYAITVSGTTMTNGSYTIPAMSTAAASTAGVGQFGMNLEVNTSPVVGTAITCPTTSGAVCKAEALSGYNTANSFQFKPSTTPGSPVLNSVADSTGAATDSQEYTASYIVNVSGSQAAGTYSSTLTYICTATF